MADSEVTMKIPEGMVQNLVSAQLAKELGGAERIVEEMVSTILSSKVRDSRNYRDEPFVVHHLKKMIGEEAQRQIAEWMEANRPRVEAALKKQINLRSSRFAKEVLDAIEHGVDHRFNYHISIKPRES